MEGKENRKETNRVRAGISIFGVTPQTHVFQNYDHIKCNLIGLSKD